MQILKPRDDAAEISAGIVDPVHGGVEPCHHVLGQDDDVGRSVGRQELREQVEHGVRALRVRAGRAGRRSPTRGALPSTPCRRREVERPCCGRCLGVSAVSATSSRSASASKQARPGSRASK